LPCGNRVGFVTECRICLKSIFDADLLERGNQSDCRAPSTRPNRRRDRDHFAWQNKPEFYVPAPLEATYLESWSHFPAPMKRLLAEPPGKTTDS
jgi:hypothetical protein